MKKLKKIKLILITIFCFMLSGCWNYHELNDLSITTGLSFDMKDKSYMVSYITVIPGKDESNSNTKTTKIYEGKGDSVSSAYNNLNNTNPKLPYMGHLDIVVISETLAQNGIIDVIDFLMRIPESRKQFYIALSKDTSASSILEVLAPLESFTSDNISKNIISNNINYSTIFIEQYSNFVSNLLETGINPVLSGIEIENSNLANASKIKTNTIGIFKQDRLLGWANEREANGIKILNNNIDSILLESTCDGKKISSTLNNIKTDTKITFNDKLPKVNISIYADGLITQIDCSKNLDDRSILDELELQFEDELKKLIDDSILLVQEEYKTDIFGYGNYIYKNYYKKWLQIQDSWDDIVFQKLDIQISTNIKLESRGSFNQTLRRLNNG